MSTSFSISGPGECCCDLGGSGGSVGSDGGTGSASGLGGSDAEPSQPDPSKVEFLFQWDAVMGAWFQVSGDLGDPPSVQGIFHGEIRTGGESETEDRRAA